MDPGIRNSPIPNPGIEKTGPGLESLSPTTTNVVLAALFVVVGVLVVIRFSKY